jgi:hypothetical protein
MTPDLLSDVGEALYGPRWQCDLARDLDISDRTIRRWVAGSHDIPQRLAAELLDLVDSRSDILDDLRVTLSDLLEEQ